MRIIIGRSRSGKTAFLMKEIAQASADRHGKQYLIVPELFSHAYERRLAEEYRKQGSTYCGGAFFHPFGGRILQKPADWHKFRWTRLVGF